MNNIFYLLSTTRISAWKGYFENKRGLTIHQAYNTGIYTFHSDVIQLVKIPSTTNDFIYTYSNVKQTSTNSLAASWFHNLSKTRVQRRGLHKLITNNIIYNIWENFSKNLNLSIMRFNLQYDWKFLVNSLKS